MKKSVRDIEVTGKRVLLRVDFNVPMQDDQILDEARIRAGLPTIRYLIEQRARVILVSHLGRPNGFVVENLRMNLVAARLADLLRIPVMKVNNCIGPEVQDAIKMMEPGQVLVLENVRFHPGEVVNDQNFAAQLASNADVLVNDAFSLGHRIQASTVGIARHIPAVAGLLMESELKGLVSVQGSIRQPVVIVLGGIRLADKGHFIDDSLESKYRMLFGGVLANTFLRAKGLNTGQSKVETQSVGLAREFLASSRHDMELPVDLVTTDQVGDQARRRVVPAAHVPNTGYIVDIGPGTIDRYSQILDGAGTVIWNGPMGMVGFQSFTKGTDSIAHKIASLDNAVKIAGGGDTLIAIDRLGLTDRFNYLSTGGAAFLDALGKEPLPAVKVLLDKEEQAVIGSPGKPSLPVV